MSRKPFDGRRRELLKLALGLPVLGGAAWGEDPAPQARRALVARAAREDLFAETGALVPARLGQAAGSAVARAVGEEGPVEAMRRLFRPSDRVGLKLNCLAGRGLAPHPELVRLLTGWLQEAGVPAGNILVWDRSNRELRRSGFSIGRDAEGVRTEGTDNDPKVGYDWTPQEWGPGASCFAHVLVKDLTALINVGVLKDHDLAGVSVGLKNWYGVIHNPNKHHDEGCAPYIPHLAAHPLIRDKLRLTVIDAVRAQCHGGPARNPKWAWTPGAVLASTDPVAMDSVGWRLIEERRREVGLPSLAEQKREPVWIEAAARLGLGQADPERIRLEDL